MPEVVTAVNTSATEETLSQPVVDTLLKELVLDLAGDMDAFDSDEVRFSFPRVTAELEEVQHLRRDRRLDDTLGDILIESDN